MTVEAFIARAIDHGYAGGTAALSDVEREIFLIAELEVCCDKDGIDSFIEVHGLTALSVCSHVLSKLGAIELSRVLDAVVASGGVEDGSLDLANRLVTDRCSYDYEKLEAYFGPKIEGTY